MLHLESGFYTKIKKFNRLSGGSYRSGYLARIDGEMADGELIFSAEGWEKCRELFHREPIMDYMLYAHPQCEGINVAAFIRAVEVRMNHKLFSEFGPTNARNASWIKPAEFWQRGHIRQSFFTVLLRCGRVYKRTKDNFNEALYEEYFTRNTKAAVERFLSGHTWYRGDDEEIWYRVFKDMSLEDVKKNLTRKPLTDDQVMKFSLQRLGLSRTELESLYHQERHTRAIPSVSSDIR